MRAIHIGVGGFGGNWIRVLKQSPKVRVVGMVDINPSALTRACEIGGYDPSICFPTLKDALRHVKADMVVSSTPPACHKEDVLTAVRAGLHAISEKPMSDSLASCKAMLKAVVASGRVYAVSQNYRYSDSMAAMASIIRSGRLGAVGQVTLDFFKGVNFGGGFRHSMPYPLIIDMSIHHFDLIRYLTGLDALNVRATAWNPSWSNYAGDCSSSAVMEMHNGARVIYNGSWCAKGSFCDWNGNWRIECEKGTLTYVNGVIKLYRVPKLYGVKKEEVITPKPLKQAMQHRVLADFISAVKNGKRPATDVFDNIRSVGMVFATVKAMETGRVVPVLDKATETILARHAS